MKLSLPLAYRTPLSPGSADFPLYAKRTP